MADPTPPKQLPPWLQRLIDLGLTALAVFLAAKYGITLPIAPSPIPQAQPLVVVVGSPAAASPVVAAAK